MTAEDVTLSIRSIAAEHATIRGGLLTALQRVQEVVGHVPVETVPVMAEAFNLSTAEVHGVLTFYRDLRTGPVHGTVVRVCRAEACQSRGSEAVHAAAQQLVSEGAHVTLDDVFCLGNCSLGPSVQIDGTLHGLVQPDGLGALVSSAAASAVTPVTVTVTPSTSAPADDAVTVYVSLDASARSVGADDVAAALAAHPGVRVVRTGSRGMFWLEPLVEVATPEGRVAFGPVRANEVPALVAGGMLDAADHPLRLGLTDELPWMRDQERLTFRRVGIVDPRSADDFETHGGLAGLRAALALTPEQVVAEVLDSGMRGKGGAAFPTGIKWKTVADAPGGEKYIACNADEGDSGTFADRMLMEGDPFGLIEGMVIAGYAVGANDSYIYIRSEYPDAIASMRHAAAEAEARGWLGSDVLGSGFTHRFHVRVGGGAYICGEETAMLESLEGRRGVVRAKPPLPALVGLFGKPTVVNNVLTLGTVPVILSHGADVHASHGMGRSRGTKVIQLAGNVARGGLLELPFGVTLGDIVDLWGGGTSSGRPVRAVQVGGPLGAYLPRSKFELPIDYESFAAADALVGHGGVVVFDDTVDMAQQARFAMEFCAHESCGKCTPCRIGAVRGVEVIDRIVLGVKRDENLAVLRDLCEVMTDGSLCAMGGLTPMPVRSALTHFLDDFHAAPGELHDRGDRSPTLTLTSADGGHA